MGSNFDFLTDKKVFSIIHEAEKLYRDGYFEQSIVQTRKFAEVIAKRALGVKRTCEETFDEILGTLQDISGKSEIEKEFIDDLYFLKKQGNLAAHESAGKQDGGIALECLKRAFEVSINFEIKAGRGNKKILNSNFSIDLLMGKKEETPAEKYKKAAEEFEKEQAAEKETKNQEKAKGIKETRKVRGAKKPDKKGGKIKTGKAGEEGFAAYIFCAAAIIILLVSVMFFILPV